RGQGTVGVVQSILVASDLLAVGERASARHLVGVVACHRQVGHEKKLAALERIDPAEDSAHRRWLIDPKTRIVLAPDVACVLEGLKAFRADHGVHAQVGEASRVEEDRSGASYERRYCAPVDSRRTSTTLRPRASPRSRRRSSPGLGGASTKVLSRQSPRISPRLAPSREGTRGRAVAARVNRAFCPPGPTSTLRDAAGPSRASPAPRTRSIAAAGRGTLRMKCGSKAAVAIT